jgi:biopolymer transport protein ExbB
MNIRFWRRYTTSRFRLILLLVLVGATLLIVSRTYAQTSSLPGGATAKPESIFGLFAKSIGFVSIVIICLSVYSVTLIIQGFIKCRREVLIPAATTATIRDLITQKHFKELVEFTDRDASFISRALSSALKRAPHFSAMKESMETTLGEQTADQFRRIEYLNIVGNLGPLLGLLGTVIGMIDAFSALHAAQGQANPADLALGISEALVNTMLGLMLAIPCLAAFGVLRTIVDRLTVQGALEAEELLLMIKPVEARPAAVARAGAIPQPAAVVRKAPVPVPSPAPIQSPLPLE